MLRPRRPSGTDVLSAPMLVNLAAARRPDCSSSRADPIELRPTPLPAEKRDPSDSRLSSQARPGRSPLQVKQDTTGTQRESRRWARMRCTRQRERCQSSPSPRTRFPEPCGERRRFGWAWGAPGDSTGSSQVRTKSYRSGYGRVAGEEACYFAESGFHRRFEAAPGCWKPGADDCG